MWSDEFNVPYICFISHTSLSIDGDTLGLPTYMHNNPPNNYDHISALRSANIYA